LACNYQSYVAQHLLISFKTKSVILSYLYLDSGDDAYEMM